jgi:hypothetical protein
MANTVQLFTDGNWSVNGFLIGTDKDFIDHMVNDNGWTHNDIIQYIMGNVACALNTTVTNMVAASSLPQCDCGTYFEYEDCVIEVGIGDQHNITHVSTPGTWSHHLIVQGLADFKDELDKEAKGKRSQVWTDHDEEPCTRVYLATSPEWEGAKLITDLANLVHAVNDKNVVSLVQLSLELSLL